MKLQLSFCLACILSVTGCGDPGSAADSESGATEDVGEASANSEALRLTPELCSKIFTFEHRVRVGDGVVLRVVEKLSGASLVRRPRRALLMLPATLVTSELYDAQVPGDSSYNALERAALAGFFAYSVDYEGYGESTAPADGRTVTFERLLAQTAKVVDWISRERHVRRVDLLGTSVGSSLAVALGSEASPLRRRSIGKLVLTANIYERFSEFVEQNVFTPELEAQLSQAPYIETGPEFYEIVLSEVEPEAAAWARSNFPGVYATGPTLEGFDLPIFDASLGRAPALQFWGSADPLSPESDVLAFQADYGGDARLHVIEGGGHSLFLEPGREEFWRETFAFLNEGDRASSRCERLTRWHGGRWATLQAAPAN